MNQKEFDQVMADLFEPLIEKQTDGFEEIFDKQLEAHVESEDENEEILRPLVKEAYPHYDPVSSQENTIFSSQSSENKSENEILAIQNHNPEFPTLEYLIPETTYINVPEADLIISALENLTKKPDKPKQKKFPSLKAKKTNQKRFYVKESLKLTADQIEKLRPTFKIMTEIVFEPLFKNLISTTVEKMLNFQKDENGQLLLNLEFLQTELNKVLGKSKAGRPRNKLQPQIAGQFNLNGKQKNRCIRRETHQI